MHTVSTVGVHRVLEMVMTLRFFFLNYILKQKNLCFIEILHSYNSFFKHIFLHKILKSKIQTKQENINLPGNINIPFYMLYTVTLH